MNIDVIRKKIEVKAYVESETEEGKHYLVQLDENGWSCTCPQHQKKGNQCKHITSVKDQEDL